ncbi:hypothetical protein FPRO03_14237 [Fusarium proliferatum]|nr:hypothetical protein FPRO03_14237 [Fusarium proliferatum]
MVIAKATEWLAEKREPAVPSAQPVGSNSDFGSNSSMPNQPWSITRDRQQAQALPEDVDDAEYNGAEDPESDQPEEDD